MRPVLRRLLELITLPLRWRFERSCKAPKDSQSKVLARLASAVAKTDYGRHHGVTDAQSFRARLPVVDYEALETWLEQQQ